MSDQEATGGHGVRAVQGSGELPFAAGFRYPDTIQQQAATGGQGVRVVRNFGDIPLDPAEQYADTILQQAATGGQGVRVVRNFGDLPLDPSGQYGSTLLQQIGDIMGQVADLMLDLPGRLATLPELFRPAAPARQDNATRWLTSSSKAFSRVALQQPPNPILVRQRAIVIAQITTLRDSALFAQYHALLDFVIHGLNVHSQASFQEFAGQYFLVCRTLPSILRDAWIAHVSDWLLKQDFTLKSVFSTLHGEPSVLSFCIETVITQVLSRSAQQIHTQILVLGAGIGKMFRTSNTHWTWQGCSGISTRLSRSI